MEKNAKEQDVELNKVKDEADRLSAPLLGFDEDALHVKVDVLVDYIQQRFDGEGRDVRVLVTGAAGSGKSTLSKALARTMGVKYLDFDKYIPGGFTSDKKEYEKRFSKGLYEMWEDVPPKRGWVIEHVEACSPTLIGLYPPDFVVLMDPGEEHLSKVFTTRSAFQGGLTLARSLQTNKTAKAQYTAVAGEELTAHDGIHLKEVEG